jgi:hypothetical protein
MAEKGEGARWKEILKERRGEEGNAIAQKAGTKPGFSTL